MVIDDSASVRAVVKLNLTREGYDVVEAVDGADALKKAESENVDLFVCDVNMPNMDGLTFVKKIKQMDKYKFSPVIMLTTESQEEKKLQGMAFGVKAWLVKPFQPEQLMGAVAKLLI